MLKKKCKYCGNELPIDDEKVLIMPETKVKQIVVLWCPSCKKENKITFYSGSRKVSKGNKLFSVIM